MKYSYEFKKECVQLYREGKWPDTPEGTNEGERSIFERGLRIKKAPQTAENVDLS